MIPGTPVCDPDYEAYAGVTEETVMYWWPDRVWRRVKMSTPRWGVASPADPDKALDEAAKLFGRDGQPKGKGRMLLAELEANGPGTAKELAARMSHPLNATQTLIRTARDHGYVRVVGRYKHYDRRGHPHSAEIYGLPHHADGDRGDAEPPAVQHLRQSRDWLSVLDIAEATGLHTSTVSNHLRRYAAHLETWPRKVRKGTRTYETIYYRWRRGA